MIPASRLVEHPQIHRDRRLMASTAPPCTRPHSRERREMTRKLGCGSTMQHPREEWWSTGRRAEPGTRKRYRIAVGRRMQVRCDRRQRASRRARGSTSGVFFFLMRDHDLDAERAVAWRKSPSIASMLRISCALWYVEPEANPYRGGKKSTPPSACSRTRPVVSSAVETPTRPDARTSATYPDQPGLARRRLTPPRSDGHAATRTSCEREARGVDRPKAPTRGVSRRTHES